MRNKAIISVEMGKFERVKIANGNFRNARKEGVEVR